MKNQWKPENSKEKKFRIMHFLKTGGTIIVLMVLLVSLVACLTESTTKPTTVPTSQPTSASTPKYGGTLRIILPIAPTSPGGWPSTNVGREVETQSLCLEPLLDIDYLTAEIKPCLAESYKVADDLKSVTFSLRKGVKFHDGSAFNAAVAKWNLDNVIEGKRVTGWGSVDAIDEYTVRVNLTKYTNTTLYDFIGRGLAFMASKEAFDKNGKDWMRNHPVGTGPFTFVSYQQDYNFKVVRNANYWKKDAQGNALPYLDGVEIKYVVDVMSQQTAMKAGEADVLKSQSAKVNSELAAAGLKVTYYDDFIDILVPDSANADSPYSKKEVREAIEYAIDREAISKAFSYGYWKAPYQMPTVITESKGIFDPTNALARKYDPAKAKQLLAQAGYDKGFKTTLLSYPAFGEDQILLAVQGYLSKVGISADIRFASSQASFNELMGSLHNTLTLNGFGYNLSYNMTFEFFLPVVVIPGISQSPLWLRSPEYVQLYNASMASTIPGGDPKLIRAVFDQLAKEAACVPLSGLGRSYIHQPYVMNADWFKRALIFWKPEQTWLNK